MIKIYPRKIERFYGYRKAQVKGGITVKPEWSMYEHILKRLCRQAGVRPDNHILFVADGLAIQFDDGEISISAEYEVGSW